MFSDFTNNCLGSEAQACALKAADLVEVERDGCNNGNQRLIRERERYWAYNQRVERTLCIAKRSLLLKPKATITFLGD